MQPNQGKEVTGGTEEGSVPGAEQPVEGAAHGGCCDVQHQDGSGGVEVLLGRVEEDDVLEVVEAVGGGGVG